MPEAAYSAAPRSRVAAIVGAILLGIAIALVAANVWPVLLLNLGAPTAAQRGPRTS